MRCRIALVTLVLAAACGGGTDTPGELTDAPATVDVSSSALSEGEPIPVRYTCDGQDLSPPLEWRVPDDTRELVVTMSDPDAPNGTFVHWVVFAIDASVAEFRAGEVPRGAQEATNDFDEAGYGGPCPPEGDPPHGYQFTVYALNDTPEGLEAGASAGQVLDAIACCVVARGTLTATYQR